MIIFNNFTPLGKTPLSPLSQKAKKTIQFNQIATIPNDNHFTVFALTLINQKKTGAQRKTEKKSLGAIDKQKASIYIQPFNTRIQLDEFKAKAP